MNNLILDNVKITLNGNTLIEVSADIKPPNIFVVMGPSGSGKSSLLAYIGGFLNSNFVATGRVILNGTDISDMPPYQRQTGLLFQDALLFPHMSVGQNLMFAIQKNIEANRRKRIVEEALESIGLESFFGRDPATLSGGQKARVALMRVLLSKPKVLLMDEPFSKLDAELRSQMRKLVFEESKNLATVLVTHDHEDAKDANGTIVKIGE